MDVLEMINPLEKYLCNKADEKKIPIGATFELLPICNMDCSMCYIRMSKKDFEKAGYSLLDIDKWLWLADEGQKQGLLFLLLTGGEPFLYKNFLELYEKLAHKGLVVSINTNGTLINSEIADRLAQLPPRRINVSIYGGSNQTYEKLCKNPQGFTQVINSVKLLKERKIDVKFNYSVTPDNIKDKEIIFQLGKEWDIPIETAYYMFPPARKIDCNINLENRLTPEQSARIRLEAEMRQKSQDYLMNKYTTIKALLSGELKYEKQNTNTAFSCRSGTSTYWINWKGEMIPCGMMDQIKCKVEEVGFKQSWEYIKSTVSKSKCSAVCKACVKEVYCGKCAACATAETGRLDGVPTYVCEAADWYVKYLEEVLSKS